MADPRVASNVASVRLLATVLRLAPWSLGVQVANLASSIALAWVLGASDETDAYFVGLSVPVFIYGVLLVAIRSGAIPPLTEVLRGDARRFPAAAGQIVSATLAASAACSFVLTAAAVVIIPTALGGGHFADQTRLTIVELAPLGVLGALTGALGALLAVRGIFAPQVAVIAIEPLLKTGLTLAVGSQIGTQALIAGNVLGSTAAAIVLWMVVRRCGVRLRLGRPLDTPLVRTVLALSAPLIISATVLQLNPVVDRTMAAALGPGSVTALELGVRLFSGTTALLSATLIGPLTATWAARRLEGGWPALQESLSRFVTALSMVLPPVVVLGFLLRRELISVLYSGGAYTVGDVHKTTQVFGMLLLCLPAQLVVMAMATLFVVYGKTVFNMWVGVANVALNVALNFALRPILGVAGIALSTTLTISILCCAYVAGMHRRWGGFAPGTVRAVVARTAASVVVTLMAGFAVLLVLPSPSGRGVTAFVAAVTIAVGMAAQGVVLGAERHLGCRIRDRLGTISRSAAMER